MFLRRVDSQRPAASRKARRRRGVERAIWAGDENAAALRKQKRVDVRIDMYDG